MHDAVIPGSAWGEALGLGAVRDEATAAGVGSSVRAIARLQNTSSGRAGDLLKIREAFSDEDVDCVGAMPGPDANRGESVDIVGHRRLSQLSFRKLRTLAGLSWRERIFGAWRSAVASSVDVSSVGTRATDASEDTLTAGGTCA